MAASALLSPADSLARSRSLLCWSTSQQAQIHAALQKFLADWQADWGLSPQEIGSADARNLSDTEARQVLQEQLFAPPSPSVAPPSTASTLPSMADVLTDEAWSDWITRLKRLLHAEPSAKTSMPAEHFTGDLVESAPSWSGCIDVVFPWWSGHWQLQLNATSVQIVLGQISAHIPKPAPIPHKALVSITTALAALPLKVSAEFSPVSLTLGQIQSLRVGDVLPLKQRLDDPTTLLLQTGAPHSLCAAWLGQSNGHMAAELSALPHSP